VLSSISLGTDTLDNFNLTSWTVDANAQRLAPNGAPSLPRFAADYVSSLSFPHSTVTLSPLGSFAHQEGFELSARDSLSSPCIYLYSHREEHERGDQKSTKTNYAFRLNLRRDPTGNYHLMPSEPLEHSHPFNVPQPSGFPKSIKSAVRRMAHAEIEPQSMLAALYHMVWQVPTQQEPASVIGTDQLESPIPKQKN
jgi:hypothetical protein